MRDEPTLRPPDEKSVKPSFESKPPRILVVEDNQGDYVLLREMLDLAGGADYACEWVRSVPEATEALGQKAHDIAFVDFHLIGGSGLDVLREAVAIDWPGPIIMVTGGDDPSVDAQAMKLGAFDFISKDEYQPDQLVRRIRYAIEKKRVENLALATNHDLLRYIAALREANNEIEQQRQRIVSLAYHLASTGHGTEASWNDGLGYGRRAGDRSAVDELGTWSFDANGRSIDANAVALALLEIKEPGALLAAPLGLLVAEESLKRLRELLVTMVPSQESTIEVELIGQRSGRRSWVVMSVLASGDEDGINAYLTTLVDITTRRNVEESTRYLARHDSLTGVFNRAVFQEHLEQATAIARRNGTLVAVLCLDLDGFKTVNDTWGHKAGDQVLKETATRLRAVTRNSDTVGRLGGDEFVVLATNIQNATDAACLAAKIVDRLIVPVDYRGEQIHCGVSVGIALCPKDTIDNEELVEFADIALYRAKSCGTVRWRYFGDGAVDGAADKKDAAGLH